ncbi:MAG: hypothetical protein JW963_14455 [Anaerolineales bacterium]|nr:hypothetical protein [Anaerolineales bacterium]
MSKRALSIILLTGIVLSACGGQAAQATETPTAVPATTAPPALPATNTPTEVVVPVTGETPTPLPTATEFVPENPADCVNKATFVSDITIPDNSTVIAGSAFTKTWRVQNAGTCIWWSGYTLTHYSEQAMSAPASVPLPVTNPGETADISVDLVAPSVAGTYQGNFVIKNPAGLIMQVDNDSRLWLIISVSSAPTGTPTATAAPGGGSATATTASTSSSSGAVNALCDYTIDSTRTAQVATAINSYRSQSNLVAFGVNTQLAQAAQRHANDMACNQLFFHNGSDGSTPQTRVAASGYTASRVAENVNGSYPPLSADQVVSWWKLDQTDINHNKNMISTQYTEIGVGYAFFNNFGYYVVVFATP